MFNPIGFDQARAILQVQDINGDQQLDANELQRGSQFFSYMALIADLYSSVDNMWLQKLVSQNNAAFMGTLSQALQSGMLFDDLDRNGALNDNELLMIMSRNNPGNFSQDDLMFINAAGFNTTAPPAQPLPQQSYYPPARY